MAEGDEDQRAALRRQRKLAEVFGDVLPDATSDERSDEPGGSTESERWYRENRPPHHGG